MARAKTLHGNIKKKKKEKRKRKKKKAWYQGNMETEVIQKLKSQRRTEFGGAPNPLYKPFRKNGIDVPVSKVTEDKHIFKIQLS